MIIPAELVKSADELKNEGNAFFLEGHFAKATELYTMAIEKSCSDKALAVYLCNRSIAQIKLENYGSALADAEAAINSLVSEMPSFRNSSSR